MSYSSLFIFILFPTLFPSKVCVYFLMQKIFKEVLNNSPSFFQHFKNSHFRHYKNLKGKEFFKQSRTIAIFLPFCLFVIYASLSLSLSVCMCALCMCDGEINIRVREMREGERVKTEGFP